MSWLWPASERTFLKRWLGLSLALHLITAWFSLGYHSADEQFQILEFLSFKLGGAPKATLAVEYGERMRPWLQVAMDYGLVRLWQSIGVDHPFVWVRSFRIFNGLIGWASIVGMALCCRIWFSSEKSRRWAIVLLSTLWYLPLLHVRPSSESLAGSAFALGIVAITLAIQIQPSPRWRWTILWLVAGAFFALSFESRFQMGLMIAGAVVWLLFQAKIGAKALLLSLAGFGVVFALGRWADFWGHGDWSFSPWNYFSYNLVRGEVSRYGQEPWWDPILRMPATESWPVLGLLATWLTLIGWVRAPRHVLTWSHLPFFLVHELIAHKEFRFFFPIALSAPVLMVFALQSGSGLWVPTSSAWRKFMKAGVALLALLNAIALGAHAVLPLARTAQFYELVWGQLPDPTQPWNLYVIGRDPYEVLGTPIYFYRPPGLQVQKVSDLREIKESGSFWLFWPKLELPDSALSVLPPCKNVVRTLPVWIRKINWNGWADRANAWSLWRCGSLEARQP